MSDYEDLLDYILNKHKIINKDVLLKEDGKTYQVREIYKIKEYEDKPKRLKLSKKTKFVKNI